MFWVGRVGSHSGSVRGLNHSGVANAASRLEERSGLCCDPTPETDGEGPVRCQRWYTLAGTETLHAELLAENEVEGTETRELKVCNGGQAERKFERELMERFLILGKATHVNGARWDRSISAQMELRPSLSPETRAERDVKDKLHTNPVSS